MYLVTFARHLHPLRSYPPRPRYSFGTPVLGTPGDGYRLCWSHDPESAPGDYKYDISRTTDGGATPFELVGPNPGDLECTLGEPCAVQVTGHRLAASNKVVPILSGACGGADMASRLARSTSTQRPAQAPWKAERLLAVLL